MKEACIVLGGGVSSEGDIFPEAKSRVEKAVELYKINFVSQLIMSGRWSFILNYTPIKTEAGAMKEYAISLGVPATKIITEESSQDTIGNAYFTKVNILEPAHWHDICVVTSDYHLERTRYIFKKIMGSEYNINFATAHSYLSDKELKKLFLREKAKLLFAKSWLDKIEDGNNIFIEAFLNKNHPAHAASPAISITKYSELIERLS